MFCQEFGLLDVTILSHHHHGRRRHRRFRRLRRRVGRIRHDGGLRYRKFRRQLLGRQVRRFLQAGEPLQLRGLLLLALDGIDLKKKQIIGV